MNSEEAIFEAAAALPAAERPAFLDQACAGQPELRARVESLLQSHDATGFMEAGATEVRLPDLAQKHVRFEPEQSGARIGRYRILQQIGEGGFGTVWMAEQLEPVTRRVALKIIKAGMDTKEVIARFEAERQALAMMDHPNIARVFDAGATEKGRPFFVMELVKGIPITRFCDEQQFTTRQRLELFADVCSAINHAHQKGIIHRNIKPSNVMVTLNADRPVVKVIDFGIAKATQGKLTDHTLFTRFEQFLGTPAYMSPEQAAISELDIDTRSDIYSLGVLLYELLTGKPPFDAKTLVSAGYEEMRRIIREVEPARPSLRLHTVVGDEPTALASARHIAPEKLNRMVEPDLDWIVMKALDKDRTRHNETANGLALDIQRFLTDEPVSAGPPSARYRFRKFARRHKAALRVTALTVLVLATAAVISTTLIAAVLVAATLICVWQAIRARMAENRAKIASMVATAKAEEETHARQDAEAVSSFLIDIFRSPDPALDGRSITVADVIDRAAERFDSAFAGRLERRARFQVALGKTYHGLGLYAAAIVVLQKAQISFSASLGPDHRETLNAGRDAGASHYEAGNRAVACEAWEKLRRRYLACLGPDDPDTLSMLIHLPQSYFFSGRLDEAHALREEVLQKRYSILGIEHPDTLAAMHDLAQSNFWHKDRRSEAVQMQEDVLSLRRKVSGIDHPETLWAMHNLADYYAHMGPMDDATGLRVQLVTQRERTLGPKHTETHWAANRLANSYVALSRWDDAVNLLETYVASSPEFTQNALALSAIQAWLGMTAKHLETCRMLLRVAEASKSPTTADHAVRSYTLAPSLNPEFQEKFLVLAHIAVSSGESDPRWPWHQVGLGMVEYRRGSYVECDRMLGIAEESSRSGAPNSAAALRATIRFFRAMCAYGRHNSLQARELFVEAKEGMLPMPLEGKSVSEWDNEDDLICWLAYKEAKALIFPEP